MVKRVVRPPTLTAAVADSIRENIFQGELQPGEPLREVELSDSLEVSRGTIREALRMLRDEGLVEVIPHRGASVKGLSLQTAKELYTLRALLEPYAVRLALENQAYSKEDLEAMKALGQRLGQLEKSGGAIYETVQADVEFHRLICSRSEHQLLLETLKRLQSLTWLFVFHIRLYQSDAYTDEPSHYEVYEAIRSGDPSHAEETLREHIGTAGRALLIRMETGA
jgi:DNA-binding GntR family transcriptional regulator